MADDQGRPELRDILVALRDEQATVREQAILDLRRQCALAAEAAEDTTLTFAEALDAATVANDRFLRQSHIAEALLAAIDDSSRKVRATTALLMWHLDTPVAEDALIRHLLSDPIGHVRKMCASALVWPPNSPRKTEAFIAALKDTDDGVITMSCIGLGKIGDDQAVGPLRVLLDHPSWRVRFSACETLVHLGDVDPRVVHILEDLSSQPEAQRNDEIALAVHASMIPGEPVPDTPPGTTQVTLEQARRILQA